MRSLILSLILLLGFVADAQLLNHQAIVPGEVTIPDPPTDPIYFPTMTYGQYSTEWFLAFFPSEYLTDGSTTAYKTVYWWSGDGGDGNPTAVTAKSMNGTGPSYSMGYSNGSQEVAWGSIVVKVNGVEVARGQYDGTIKGPGVTGTTSHTTGNGTLWVTFDSTPTHTPTVDYLYSPVFEAGLPKYLNRGDTLDGKTIVFIIHRASNDQNYGAIEHYDDPKNYLEAIYRVDSDRRIAAGLSRGGIQVKNLMINRNTQIAGYLMTPTDLSGTVPWASLYDKGIYFISGQNDVTTAVPNANYMNTIGGSHSGFRFYPKFTLYDAQAHASNNGALWNAHSFDRSTAPFDWVAWASLWNLDLDKQCEQHVEHAETTLSIDDYRDAARAVSFMTAGAAKTALQTRLSTLKSTIDDGRKRWYIDAGATAPVTPGVNQAANFSASQNYTNLPDDNGDASGVGFSIVNQLSNSGTNRVSTDNRAAVPGFGFAHEEWYDFASQAVSGTVSNGQVKWTGLNSGKTYRVVIYATGANGTVTNDIFLEATVGGTTKEIFTQLTNTRKLEWTGVAPSSNEIVISDINNAGNTGIGAGIQVFMLEEEN